MDPILPFAGEPLRSGPRPIRVNVNVTGIGLVVAALALGSACGGPGSQPEGPTGTPTPAAYVVTGHLKVVGGPAPGAARPGNGTVTLTTADGESTTVQTDADGRFGVAVSTGPGRYTLTGHSPQFGDGAYECRATGPVVVSRSTRTVHADVFCQMK
jgi:hypothetical protein